MKAVVVSVAVTLSGVLVGCADNGGSQTSSDCSTNVRVDDNVYTSHGYTERKASRHSAADAADCHDTGEVPAGSVFPEHPGQVTTWTFRGYPPEKVLGVRFDIDSFAVFVTDSVPRAERERIFRELEKPVP
jgi:hypothetical protein